MDIIYFAFMAIACPVFFFMITWAVVMIYQRFFPEAPRPLHKEPVAIRRVATARGASVPVGAREIREDQRHYFNKQAPASYSYAHGESEGFPVNWDKDLWRRRN